VRDGAAYFAAGIIDHDGTHVYALDARTGALLWQNNSSGHLNPELRKGVSVQGNLSVRGDELLLAGGNQVSPVHFALADGRCLAQRPAQGNPSANGGKFVGVFNDDTVIQGGRILYSSPRNVPTKGFFAAFSASGVHQLNQGGVPPAWNGDAIALVNFKYGKITCVDARKAAERLAKGRGDAPGARRDFLSNLTDAFRRDGAVRFETDLGEPEKFEAVSLAIAPDQVLAVVQFQQRFRSQPQWFVAGLDIESGEQRFRHELDAEPLPGGLAVGGGGEVLVTLLDGGIACFK
jgi:hypothetical protein